jgi:hypothetical protein
MEYEFRSASGETISRIYPVDECPRIGARIRVKGRTYTRVFSIPRAVAVAPNLIVGHSLRRAHQPLAPDYAALGVNCISEGRFKGAPVFKSLQQVREFTAREDHKIGDKGKIEYEF